MAQNNAPHRQRGEDGRQGMAMSFLRHRRYKMSSLLKKVNIQEKSQNSERDSSSNTS